MRKKGEKKPYHHFKITTGMGQEIERLIKRNGWTKSTFMSRALDYFFSGEMNIDERFLITKRSDPNYVSRDGMLNVRIEKEQFEQIEKVAQMYDCKFTIVVFQALFDYCSLEIELDPVKLP